MDIIIIGAGIGGLAAACCLLQAGHRVRVYERANTLSEVGAGIQMSANAMHVLRHIGVAQSLDSVGVRPRAYVFRLHDTGEVIQEFSLSAEHERQHGAPYIQLHRADLHDVLAARARELKPDVVQLDHTALGFEEDGAGVTVRFTNGTTARGDALIGADGLKSTIARQIVGPIAATYTGDAAWRLTVPVEHLPRDFLEQAMSIFMGPAGHSVCYYLRAGTLLNFVGILETDEVSEESWTQRFPWTDLKRAFIGWHPAIQTIIDAADRDQCYRWSLHNRPPVRGWSTARATILGDAAHATLPYLAQGAAMAIEDGAVLMRALAQAASIPEALALYERNRVDRTARIVAQSTDNRRLFHLPSKEAIRAEFARRNEGEDRNRWLYSYNPLTVELV